MAPSPAKCYSRQATKIIGVANMMKIYRAISKRVIHIVITVNKHILYKIHHPYASSATDDEDTDIFYEALSRERQ